MPSPGGPRPERPVRAELAAELRRLRLAARRTTRQVGNYTSGHISPVERGQVAPSWDLVKEYVKFGGEHDRLRELYERMLEETRQLRARHLSGHAVHLPPRRVADITHHDEVRSHYVVHSRNEDYLFDRAGVVRQVVCSCTITARSPGVLLYYCRHTYDADQRPGVLRVSARTGCSVAHTHEAPTGTIRTYLRLDRELYPSDTTAHQLSYQLNVDSDKRTHPRLLFHAGPETEKFALRVTFQAPSLPTEIWSFAERNEIGAQDPKPERRLPVSRQATYLESFDRLIDGWCYGLSWRW